MCECNRGSGFGGLPRSENGAGIKICSPSSPPSHQPANIFKFRLFTYLYFKNAEFGKATWPSGSSLVELLVCVGTVLQPLGCRVIYLMSSQANVLVQSSLEGFDIRSVDYGRYQCISIVDDEHAERISLDSGDGPGFEEFPQVLTGVGCSRCREEL